MKFGMSSFLVINHATDSSLIFMAILIFISFIRSLKVLCTDGDSKIFWESIVKIGRPLSLISSTEAEPLGGKSNVSEDESKKVSEE